jgi:type I restriction enzyme S subunit
VELLGEKSFSYRERIIRSETTTRIKFLSEYITSGSRDWSELYADEGELFIRIGNVSGKDIDLDLRKKTFVNIGAKTEGLRTRLKKNDLLVSITADLGSVGVVGEESEGAYINQHLALVRLNNNKCDARFIAHTILTRSVSDQFKLRGYGGTKQGLSLKDVAEIFVPFPNKTEQVEISKDLDAYFSMQRLVKDNIDKSFIRLREYRSALITAAVTGQIDITKWVKSGTADCKLDAVQATING